MITEFRAQNFKSWEDTKTLHFAPLTGFFGANSSGKTSILQVLRLLKQTVERPSLSWDYPLYFGNDTSLVNLGSFDDVIHQHNSNLNLGVSVSWKLSEEMKIDERLINSISFSTSIGKKHDNLILKAYCYSANGQKWRLESNFPSWKFEFPDFLVRTGDPAYSAGTIETRPFSFYKIHVPDGHHATLLPLIDSLENLFNRILYLGPLRDNPRPHYNWRGEPPEGVGQHGEEMVSALFSSRIQLSSIDEHVPKWLQSLGLIDSYRIAPVLRTQKDLRTQRDYEFLVTKHKGAPEVRLTDVGFGVSQVLPVLILCYYAPEGSILILEQPEAHLHPKVQSELGDVLIDVVKKRNIQVILESHSEHLIHRLMLRTAEEQLSVDDTALYFCQINEGVSEIDPLQVDEYGNISNWPREFFGDVTGDLIKQGRAEVKRRKANKL